MTNRIMDTTRITLFSQSKTGSPKRPCHIAMLLIATLAFATNATHAATPHTFTLDTSAWEIKPKTVSLAGDFNSWNPSALAMTKKGTVWSATVPLTDGKHAYKFVVDKSRWITDPKADKALEADDGNGGKNSVVAVSPTDAPADTDAPPDPSARPADEAPADAPKAGTYRFTIDVSAWQEKPKKLSVAGDFNNWNKDASPLKAKGDVWSADVSVSNGKHAYKFVADGERWLQDPKADPALDADDGNGGKNSVVNVGAPAPAAGTGSVKAAPAGFEFSLDTSPWQEKPKAVNLAGDFNGWSMDAMPMQQTGDVWSLRVPVVEGNHAYKFVIDHTKWLPDPKADKALETDDGNGGMNSGVVVGPDARKLPPPQPNAVNTEAVLFDPKSQSDLNVVDTQTVRLRVRLQAGDAEHVYVRSTANVTEKWPRTELHKLGSTYGYDSFGGEVTTTAAAKDAPLLHYYFEFTDGTADVLWADGKRADNTPTPPEAAAMQVSLTPSFETPAWAEHVVWYQIFPERFKNGDPSNDPSNDEGTHLVNWTSRWWDVQPGEKADGDHFAYDGRNTVYDRRYGGDIQGCQQALPYLKSLGITALYFNPVFEAASMHKYDATDYRHIDNHFGVKGDWPVAGETEDPATWKWSPSDKIFLDFVAEAHKQGFKVVVDGVFNHVGRPCPFFQDVLENGKNSKYADWFEITDWGDPANWHKMPNPLSVHGRPGGIQWNAWDGKNGSLPNWRKDPITGMAAGPMAFIDGITKRWLAPDGDPSRGIDGFRLDAAEQVPHPFWVQWRNVVKAAKPDAYITGEIWNPAQPWINDGKQFDAVMNYQFAMPAVAFFANQKSPMAPSAFAKKLGDVLYMYPQQASRAMMNLFDSHDTDRVASMFVNPDRAYDAGNRLQDPDAKNYSARKPTDVERQRMMQAVALQMTFLGAPMIYYGDEAGMWSPDDPSDRMPMTWPGLKFADPQVGFNQDVFDAYQRLIAIRNTLPVLQTGDYWPVLTDDTAGTLVFARGDGKTTAYVAFNRSDKPQRVVFDSGTAALVPYNDWNVEAGGARPVVQQPKTVADSTTANGRTTVDLAPYGYAILAPAH